MANTPPPAVLASNSQLSKEDLGEIADLTRQIIALENDRGEVNADINAARAKIKAKGINMAAFNASLARFRMDVEQREAFDQSRSQCDEALGIPVQADLFADADDDDSTTTSSKDTGLPAIH